MTKNRIEVLTNVVPIGSKFRVEGQIRFIHDTVIQQTSKITGQEFDNEADARAHQKTIETILQRTLDKVKTEIPTAEVFKHEFKK